MRLLGVRDADRDTVHGGARVRRPPSHDLKDVLPAAEELREAEPRRPPREHEGARRRRREGHAKRQLGGLQ